MKKTMKLIGAAALAALTLAACNKDPQAGTGLTSEEKALKEAVETYVPQVIYKIYGNLANETETLYNQLAAPCCLISTPLNGTRICWRC